MYNNIKVWVSKISVLKEMNTVIQQGYNNKCIKINGLKVRVKTF